jgi:hypothetical protein
MNCKVGKNCQFNNCLLRYYLLKNFIGNSFTGPYEELERTLDSIGRIDKVRELKNKILELKHQIYQNTVKIFCARPLIVKDVPNKAAIIREQ